MDLELGLDNQVNSDFLEEEKLVAGLVSEGEDQNHNSKKKNSVVLSS